MPLRHRRLWQIWQSANPKSLGPVAVAIPPGVGATRCSDGVMTEGRCSDGVLEGTHLVCDQTGQPSQATERNAPPLFLEF